MNKPFTILLAALVFVANAYCACANADAQRTRSHTTQAVIPSHPGCHGHDDTPDHPGQKDHDSHSCGHCTGTVTTVTSNDKTTLPAPLLSPFEFAAPPADLFSTTVPVQGTGYGHFDLPPPLQPPTLLNLGCCLNT